MFKKYKTRPSEILSIKVTEENIEDVFKYLRSTLTNNCFLQGNRIKFYNLLHSSYLEVYIGEYLCKGKNIDDYYPCKESVFNERYEEVAKYFSSEEELVYHNLKELYAGC